MSGYGPVYPSPLEGKGGGTNEEMIGHVLIIVEANGYMGSVYYYFGF